MLQQLEHRLPFTSTMVKLSLVLVCCIYLPNHIACDTFLEGLVPLGRCKTLHCDRLHALSTAHSVASQLGSGAGSVPHLAPPISGSGAAAVHAAAHSDIEASDSGRRLDAHVTKDPSLSQRLFLAPNSSTETVSFHSLYSFMWPFLLLLLSVFACMMPASHNSHPPSFDPDDRVKLFVLT